MSADPQVPRFVPPSRRRDKPILSCTLCRRRKLKCDRQQPCKTCVDRGLSLSCAYVRNVPAPKEPKIPNSVHDRINQLEKLVTDLMTNKNAAEVSPAASYTPQHQDDSHYEIPGTPDRVKFNGETTSYTNGDHWTSILDGISELREHLDQIPTSADAKEESEELPGPEILFGRQRFATKEDVLAALPPRAEADQLIDTYFATMETHTSSAFLHRPTFLKQYANFWLNPFQTPSMWIGLLYAAFALGTRFQATIEKHLSRRSSSGSSYTQSLYEARMNFYREKAVQCMILANYLKCPPFTIEAFMLYFGTEYSRCADAQFSSYVMVGMVVRLAFRMGLHRDPARFLNISPFEGEMRRRKWLTIVSIDLMTSSHLGLPRMIHTFMYDTQEPRNLTDDDIYEDMPEPLPPSRPETDLTQLLYFILICKIRKIQAQMLDLMETTQQPPYKTIIDLDAALRLVIDKFPKAIETHSPDAASISGMVMMRQTYLQLAYLKAQVMLHRPYIKVGRADQHYEYSRRVCVNAAIELLTLQSKLDDEIHLRDSFSQPLRIFALNGVMSSIVAQDFLLATSVLILDLDEDLISPLPASSGMRVAGIQHLDSAPPSRQEIVASLRSAYDVWLKASKNSQEARKAAAAVKLVLSKANESEEHAPSPSYAASDAVVEHDTYPPSTLGANDYMAGNTASAMFPMAGSDFNHPAPYEQMPMDLDSLNIPFEWDGMMANLQLPPYGDMAHPPF